MNRSSRKPSRDLTPAASGGRDPRAWDGDGSAEEWMRGLSQRTEAGATSSCRGYSSSSPKKNWLAHRREQKMRPYSCRPQSSHTHLKQIGHLCSAVSRSLFWQWVQFIAAGASIAPAPKRPRAVVDWADAGGGPVSRYPWRCSSAG